MRKNGGNGNGRRRNSNGQFWQAPQWLLNYIQKNERAHRESNERSDKRWQESNERLERLEVVLAHHLEDSKKRAEEDRRRWIGHLEDVEEMRGWMKEHQRILDKHTQQLELQGKMLADLWRNRNK